MHVSKIMIFFYFRGRGVELKKNNSHKLTSMLITVSPNYTLVLLERDIDWIAVPCHVVCASCLFFMQALNLGADCLLQKLNSFLRFYCRPSLLREKSKHPGAKFLSLVVYTLLITQIKHKERYDPYSITY